MQMHIVEMSKVEISQRYIEEFALVIRQIDLCNLIFFLVS